MIGNGQLDMFQNELLRDLMNRCSCHQILSVCVLTARLELLTRFPPKLVELNKNYPSEGEEKGRMDMWYVDMKRNQLRLTLRRKRR